MQGKTAIGVRGLVLNRHAPTLVNLAWSKPFGWDGGYNTLEEQTIRPLTSKQEMDTTFEMLISRLSKIEGYRSWFNRLFPEEGVAQTSIVRAIVTFQRTIVSGTSSFDRWVNGDDAAVSADVKRGFELFSGRAGCSGCHSGWNFTDGALHDPGRASTDKGLGELFPENPATAYKFKTSTLRNISLRAPYTHNGSYAHLGDLIKFYANGGKPRESNELVPFSITELEVSDLVAFLNSLTEDLNEVSVPRLPVE